MMLVSSFEQPHSGRVQIFFGTKPILEINAEHPLRRGKALLRRKLYPLKSGYRVLFVAGTSALFLVLQSELELGKRITGFGCRNTKLSRVRPASPESAE